MSQIALSDQDALALAKGFRAASNALGDYLYAHWQGIAPAERARLQTLEIALLNIASDLTTQAVGIIIDESKLSLAQLNAATGDAVAVIARLDKVAKAFDIVTSLIALASAIPAGNPGALLGAWKKLHELVRVTPDKPLPGLQAGAKAAPQAAPAPVSVPSAAAGQASQPVDAPVSGKTVSGKTAPPSPVNAGAEAKAREQ